MMHTRSATPLERVMIEPSHGGRSHVWLRRDITETTETYEGQPIQIYEADEIHYLTDGTPTASEVEAEFSALWIEHEGDDLTPLEKVQRGNQLMQDALVEIVDLLAGGE